MALLSCTKTGVFSSSATWETVAASNLNASVNVSITTAGVNSATWTAPNTTNAITGVWVYAATLPASGRNWTAQLQESTVNVGTAATMLQTDMPQTASWQGWVYFRLASPYTYTTLTAGAYRWVFKSTTANSGSMAADATTTSVASIMPTDDRASVPGTADHIWVGSPNGNTQVTLTVDGANDLRGGSSNAANLRTVTLGAYVGGSGTADQIIVKADTAATNSLVITGDWYVSDGGHVQQGTVASPFPGTSSVTTTFSVRQTSGTVMRFIQTNAGKWSAVGPSRDYLASVIVSGVGTIASPLVLTDPVNWSVGDRVQFPPSSNNAANYSESENRFVISKIDNYTYTLSSSIGGAETALVNSHYTAVYINRYVNFTQVTTSGPGAININATTQGLVNLKWAYFSGLGSTAGTATVLSSTSIYGLTVPATVYAAIDYCSFELNQAYSLIMNSRNTQTYTGNTFFGGTAASANHPTMAGLGVGGANLTFNDTYIWGNTRQGIDYVGSSVTFNRLYVSGCNGSNTASNGGIYIQGGGPLTINNGNVHACRGSGFLFNSVNLKVVNSDIGNRGTNAADLSVTSNTATRALFTNCNLGSPTLATNYLNGSIGATLILFDRLNQTANNHRWYTNYGSARSTGASLGDTLVKTVGSLGLRLDSENSTTGFDWRFSVPATAGQIINFFGWFQKNAAFGTDTAKIELFLPGNDADTGTADASYTMTNNTGVWEAVSISAANTGNTVDLFATIKITAKTTTANASLYADTFYNADTTQKLTGLDIWKDGQPSPVILSTAVSPADIWTYNTTGLTTANTTGLKLIQGATKGDLAALD